jgi:hypothetical protein
MEEVFRMYAKSDGAASAKPAKLNSGHDNFEED